MGAVCVVLQCGCPLTSGSVPLAQTLCEVAESCSLFVSCSCR